MIRGEERKKALLEVIKFAQEEEGWTEGKGETMIHGKWLNGKEVSKRLVCTNLPDTRREGQQSKEYGCLLTKQGGPEQGLGPQEGQDPGGEEPDWVLQVDGQEIEDQEWK